MTSVDGTPIVTHFYPAEGLAPGARAPTVLVGHGYGMSGDTDPESQSEDLFGSVGLGPLRRAGFNVLTWDGLRGEAVRVTFDRPIRVGERYRFSASGQTAEGRRLDASRRVRVRGRPRALRLGAARAMRLARPGRPFAVRVRPVRTRARGVRVIVRDRRGRRIGSSRRFAVGTRGRSVRVRVTRRVAAGARYRFSARGRGADGRRLSATRRVRVRR